MIDRNWKKADSPSRKVYVTKKNGNVHRSEIDGNMNLELMKSIIDGISFETVMSDGEYNYAHIREMFEWAIREIEKDATKVKSYFLFGGDINSAHEVCYNAGRTNICEKCQEECELAKGWKSVDELYDGV